MPAHDEQTQPGDPEATIGSQAGADTLLPHAATGRQPPSGEPQRFSPGDRIDQFVVTGELGAGAMGVVLAARDPDLDRAVAIKLVRPRSESANTDGAQQRMLREAQSMAKIAHPNVVTVHQVGFQSGQLFIAMELIDGRTLREWSSEQPRSLTDVLGVFSAAGRGLAAAHAVGLVHRDFKPDNVLVSHDGRVAVTDFGLVGIAGAGRTGTDPTDSTKARELSASADASLTATGSIMGSPAYMAVEQHRGAGVDHRADQFAFCVSLWEALYGQRPFHRETLAELVYATLEGEVPPPSRTAVGGSVPKAIERALRRGLRPDAGARWPNMQALLARLRYDPRAGRRRIAVGVAAVAGLGLLGAGAAWALQKDDRPACDAGPQRRAEVWNESLRDKLSAGLASTGSALASNAGAAVTARLDTWATTWEREYRDACEATAHRGEQSGKLLDQRMRCLERSRADVGRLVNALIEADAPEVVSKATAAATSSTVLAQCAPERLHEDAHEQIDGAVALAAPVRGAIDAAVLLDTLGNSAEAVTALESLRPEVDELGQDAVLAELLLQTGRVLARAGRPAHSEPVLAEAIAKAADAGGNDLEAKAMLAMAETVGSYLGDAKRALGILAGAASAVRHADDPTLEAYYERSMGGMLYMTQQYAPAEQHLRKALEVDLAASDNRSGSLASTYNVLAILLGDLGRTDEALDAHEAALKHTQAHYGPGHPNLAVIRNNRGAIYRIVGRRDDAREDHERALKILHDSVGDEHPWVAMSHDGLGILAQESGDLDTASSHYAKTLAIREASYGSEHVTVATSLHNMASIALLSAEPLQASTLWLRARAIWVATGGEHQPSIADIDQNLGQLAMLTGDLDLAQRRFSSALQVSQVVFGEEHPQLIPILANYAGTLHLLGNCTDAAPLVQRALALAKQHQRTETLDYAAVVAVQAWCELGAEQYNTAAALFGRSVAIHEAHGSAPYPLARAHYGEAQALLGAGRETDARTAAKEATEQATAADRLGETLREEIDTWRATELP